MPEETAVGYVELHCHSCYSLREGASTPEQLLREAKRIGYPVLAMTDHDGLYGAMEFAKAAEVVGVRPITGAELTLTGGYHLTLLVETKEGYHNLCRLITEAYRKDRDNAEVTFEILRDRTEGLIALSGCSKGEVAQWVTVGNIEQARSAAIRYREWFGPENFFVELQNNLVQGDKDRNAALVKLAVQLGLGYVATNNVHYHVRERHRVHDVLVAIHHRSTLDSSHTLRRPNSEFYLKTPEEMADLFADYPRALSTSVEIAERCRFQLHRDLGYEFPDFGVPEGQTEDTFLAQVCWESFRRKYGASSLKSMMRREGRAPGARESVARIAERRTVSPGQRGSRKVIAFPMKPGADPEAGVEPDKSLLKKPGTLFNFPGLLPGDLRKKAMTRLETELRLIKKHRLAGFFLTYREILKLGVQVAHELRGRDPALPPDEQPVGRGRGSSVASIVCYLIGLSHIDPVKNDLFLGRFLNEELASIPDIDLDFPRDIRAELLQRIYDHFGTERSALVCAYPTYRTRNAIRDVGKALGLPEPMIDKLAKMSDHWGDNLGEEMARLPEFKDKVDAPIWRDMISIVEQVRGFPRHISQHVGGIVLANRPIHELVPVEPTRMDGRYVIQWDKDSVDDARMVKFDFLALGMLSAVDECLDTIGERYGERPDLGRIPYDDEDIYDQICAGDTIGVFQIESRAQVQTLPRTQPRNIDDLAVQVAIIRPGPIVSGAFHPYMEYRQRLAAGEPVDVQYLHPSLEPALKETLGVVLYQDQVLQIAMSVAGFSAGEADMLRRAMSRKRSFEALNDQWPRFLEGTTKNGVDPEISQQIFKSLLGFSSFGFPKSHAVAFALLSYESTWLRHYYPAEYYAALLNNQPMGFYTPEVVIGDAKRHGVITLQPDINESNVGYRVETDDHIRVGLMQIKSVGKKMAEFIVEKREERGPFRSLFEFTTRTRLKREPIESLILAGAFDSLGMGRRELLWQLGLFYEQASDQERLPLVAEGDQVSLPAFSEWERVIADFTTQSLSTYRHPMSIMRLNLPHGVLASNEIGGRPDGAPVQVAGMVVCRQRPGTAKGVVFLLMEDEHGLTNVVVYANLYDRQRLLIRHEPFLMVRGTLQSRHNTINIVAESFSALPRPTEMPAPESHNFH